MKQTFNFLRFSTLIAVLLIWATATLAQTTAFTYQGRFTDSTLPQPTNGSYEMQYKLFDTSVVGTGLQNGITLTVPSVAVVNGIFTVQLDFGGGAFRANSIFVEIGVRPVGSASAFTVLGPRQQITAAPLAVRSEISDLAVKAGDSDALGGVPANQFVQTNDSRLADDRNPLAGSPNYVQNGTAPQTSSNFNISNDGTVGGTLTANIVKATTQFNIGTNRVLSVGSGNIFAGVNTGTVTTGGDNTFVGTNAGMTNVTGFNNAFFGTDAGRTNTATNNSFFGRSAGFANTTGGNNSFFGLDAGRFNTTGANNAFFGLSAGGSNTFGTDNSFVGLSSGFSNTIGSNNAFVGRSAGQNNSTGSTNSFFGNFAGAANTIGNNNSAVGNSADFGANNLNFATAIGAGSVVSTSNTLVLGRNLDTVIAPNLLQVNALGAAGATSLCRNASNQISTCTAGGGGGSFINNSTVLQPTSNFNISGGGIIGGTLSANTVNSTTVYKIGNANVFATPNQTSVVAGQLSNYTLLAANSTFIGFKAGQAANSFSQANTFIGSDSGESNTGGGNNTFVGRDSGLFNTTGSLNSFFGSGAGQSNSTADANSFFGYESGFVNSTGTRNAFFGFQTGRQSATINDNSFFGFKSGNVTTGGDNSFFGSQSGVANTSGAGNSFFGSSSGAANNGGTGNSFFGKSAGLINTGGSANTFIGESAGFLNTNGSGNTVVGVDSSSLNGDENVVIGSGSQADGNQNTILGDNSFSTGTTNTVIGYFAKAAGSDNTAIGSGARVQPFTPGFPGPTFATAIGAGTVANLSNSVFLGREIDVVRVPGKLNVDGSFFGSFIKTSSLEITGETKLTAISSPTNNGSTPLCRNGNNLLSACPSNLTNNSSGFTKELTAQIETQAAQIKQQQTTIDKQAEQIKLMQTQMEALKAIVCSQNPTAEFCKENKK